MGSNIQIKDNVVISVIIADDHMLFKAAVKTVLSSKKNIKIIAEAENGSELLNLLKTTQPNVILLDIQMPIMDGVAILPEIKKLYPDIRVIMLSTLDDQRMVTKLLELGANAYLIKTCDSEIIYEAIKTCYEQEFYFNALTNKALLNNLREKNASYIRLHREAPILSQKESTILRLMCEEKNTREIAEAVDLSPRTIEAIRDKLKTKTGTKSTAGLIMFAIKNNIVLHVS